MRNIQIWKDNISVFFQGSRGECTKVAQDLDILGVEFQVTKLPETLAEPEWFGHARCDTYLEAKHLVELLRLP